MCGEMRWGRWRLWFLGRRPVGALTVTLLCLAALGIGPGGSEAAGVTRPHITWTVVGNAECKPRVVCVEVQPGDSASVDITIATDSDIVTPRLVLQTPNGARVMRVDSTALPSTLTAGGTPQAAQIAIDVPPGFRASQASGRLYVADKGSVLVPPLNVRVQILHPSPIELALTPVVIPTNHIKLLANRFNIRDLTIISGTNVTWTNKDVRQHSVKGSLCDPTLAFDRTLQCGFDASVTAGATCNVPDPTTGRFVCLDSGPLGPEANFSLRLTRPNPREILHYFMEDGLSIADDMTGYLTVK